jgi:CDP-glucose 4,6-dehydratase
MKYFVTGHTGFKGSWLVLLLKELGHEVHGYSLDSLPGSLFDRARLSELCDSDIRADIRDSSRLQTEILRVNPDVIIHLAAQPLVRYSYEHPEETFTTNVNGTLNLLSAALRATKLSALVVVTTDKVYLNTGKKAGYVETDPLGGLDPYSASKAAADILSQSWSHTFSGMPIAIARAGNVVGGGDVSKDRLIPEILAAFFEGRQAEIRNPTAVRPWQHVLDCVNGYLTLIREISNSGVSGAWNFGPDVGSVQTVKDVANLVARKWSGGASWVSVSEGSACKEDDFLLLDSAKSQRELNWKNKFTFLETITETVEWARKDKNGSDILAISENSVRSFLKK